MTWNKQLINIGIHHPEDFDRDQSRSDNRPGSDEPGTSESFQGYFLLRIGKLRKVSGLCFLREAHFVTYLWRSRWKATPMKKLPLLLFVFRTIEEPYDEGDHDRHDD